MKVLETFEISEKELIEERRLGVIARLFNEAVKFQRKTKRDVFMRYKGVKDGLIVFEVVEKMYGLAINDKLELGIVHVDENGEIIENKIKRSLEEIKEIDKLK